MSEQEGTHRNVKSSGQPSIFAAGADKNVSERRNSDSDAHTIWLWDQGALHSTTNQQSLRRVTHELCQKLRRVPYSSLRAQMTSGDLSDKVRQLAEETARSVRWNANEVEVDMQRHHLVEAHHLHHPVEAHHLDHVQRCIAAEFVKRDVEDTRMSLNGELVRTIDRFVFGQQYVKGGSTMGLTRGDLPKLVDGALLNDGGRPRDPQQIADKLVLADKFQNKGSKWIKVVSILAFGAGNAKFATLCKALKQQVFLYLRELDVKAKCQLVDDVIELQNLIVDLYTKERSATGNMCDEPQLFFAPFREYIAEVDFLDGTHLLENARKLIDIAKSEFGNFAAFDHFATAN